MEITDVIWFERELASGGLFKIADDGGPIPQARQLAKTRDREQMLADDPFVEVRLVLVNGLLARGIEPHDPRLGEALDDLWTPELKERFGTRPPTSTVRTWFGRVRGGMATMDELFSMSGRVPRRNGLDPEVDAIIDEERRRYWANLGYKIVDVESAVSTRIETENLTRLANNQPPLARPGKETIRRRVNEMECRDTYAEKYGGKAARRKYDGSGNGIQSCRILQIGLMDDTVVDLVTCLDADRGMVAGRPYLTVLIDVYSRCVLGYSVSFIPPTARKATEVVGDASTGKAPSTGRASYDPDDPAMRARIAVQCVRVGNEPKHAIRPDRLARYPELTTLAGKFTRIITDNGANYVSPAFSEMLADLGIIHELAPVGSPRHKAIIERFFRSLNTFLINKLPGTTLDPTRMRQLGIDPETKACITITELHELIGEFLYLYHISHHSGIDAVPLQRWASSMRIHGRDMILDRRAVDIATGVTVYKKRVTANGGVRMFGMTWKGINLPKVTKRLGAREPHRQRLDGTTAYTTNIKYNPEDMLYVQVLCGDEWIELENTQAEYAAGLTLWQHKQVQAWAKRQSLEFNSEAERLAARDELNRAIREAFPDMEAREKRAMARMLGPKAATPDFDAQFAEAEPRHDGMGPIIEHSPAAPERLDTDRKPGRPSKVEASDPDLAGTEDAEAEGTDGDTHQPIMQIPHVEIPQIEEVDFEEYV
jgi:putative transposase